MKKVKKTTIWDRIRNAARALRCKPADSIEIGMVIKRCDQCKRGDCDSCVYKGEFERLMELPNCNDCALNASSYSCNYRPRIGENVRINCPMWKPKEEVPEE